MRKMIAIAAVLGLAATAHAAQAPGQKCQASKNELVGKYTSCQSKAESKLLKTKGACSVTTATVCYADSDCPVSQSCTKDQTKYAAAEAKCNDTLEAKWESLSLKASEAGDPCPDTGSLEDIKGALNSCIASVQDSVAGGDVIDLGAELAACNGELSTCESDLGTATTSLETCTHDLAACESGGSGEGCGLKGVNGEWTSVLEGFLSTTCITMVDLSAGVATFALSGDGCAIPGTTFGGGIDEQTNTIEINQKNSPLCGGATTLDIFLTVDSLCDTMTGTYSCRNTSQAGTIVVSRVIHPGHH